MTMAIDLESIRRLTNLADINRALHETHARERSIEAELEELLSKRDAIEETFVTLHDSASEVRMDLHTCLLDCDESTLASRPLYSKMYTFFCSCIVSHAYLRLRKGVSRKCTCKSLSRSVFHQGSASC